VSNATLAGVLRPCEKRWAGLYDICLIAGGSLLIGLSAHIKIVLPFSVVPVTGQTFAVLMIGALLGAKRGSLCVLAYIAEGIAGLPVFALGAGPGVLLGPTGGYIVGFVAAAYIVGLLAEKGWDRRVGTTVLAMAVSNVVIYAFGLAWLCWLIFMSKVPMRFNEVLVEGLYPIIVGDCLKIMLAAGILPSGWRLLEKIRAVRE